MAAVALVCDDLDPFLYDAVRVNKRIKESNRIDAILLVLTSRFGLSWQYKKIYSQNLINKLLIPAKKRI